MSDSTRWLTELRHSWPLLAGRYASEIATTPLSLAGAPAQVRVGVDGTGARHLLVPMGEDDLRIEPVDGALRTQLRTYTFSRVPMRYLDVSCTRSDLFDLFDEVLTDVLVAAEREKPDKRARVSIEVVGRWRALLSTHRARLLTLVGQMSLFTELTVLDLVTRDRDLDMQWWRGPRREPHDILLPEVALEVKAVGGSSTAVEIHGIRQLDPPGKPLALVLATVVEGGRGRSLPELVDAVLRRATGRGEGVRLLTTAGYNSTDAEHYTERFEIADLSHVVITDAVPRIVPESLGERGLPAGIDNVSYRVDIDALAPFAVRGDSSLIEWAASA